MKKKVINIQNSYSLHYFIKIFGWILFAGGIIGGFYYLYEMTGTYGLKNGSGVVFIEIVIASFIVLFFFLAIAKIIEHLYVMRQITEKKAEDEGYEIKKGIGTITNETKASNSTPIKGKIYCKYCEKYISDELCEHIEYENGRFVYMDGEVVESENTILN